MREQRHRRHRLQRAQLDPQVLGEDHAERAHRPAPVGRPRVAGRDAGRRAPRRRPPAGAEHQRPVALAERRLDVVADEHAGEARTRGRSAARPSRPPRGRGASAARRAAGARARAAPRGRRPRAGPSRPRGCGPARSPRRSSPTAPSSSPMRSLGVLDAVKARLEGEVLGDGQVAVEQGLVRRAGRSARAPSRPAAAARRPRTSTSPSLGRSSVARIRTRVVLPAPFGPRTARVAPAASSNETSSRATRSP